MIKTTIGVEGMMCHNCEKHMDDAIRETFGVRKVNSSHEENRTEIISEEPIAEEELRKTVEQTGYRMTSYETAPYEKKGFSAFKK